MWTVITNGFINLDTGSEIILWDDKDYIVKFIHPLKKDIQILKRGTKEECEEYMRKLGNKLQAW